MGQALFDETLAALYDAAAAPETWSDALGVVADHIGGSGAMIVHNAVESRRASIITGRLREDLNEVYLQNYCFNPITTAVLRSGRIGEPALAGRLVDMANIRRTAFHADILAPQAIADQIVLPHRLFSREGASGGVGIVLTARQADESHTAMRRMRRLTPHLLRTLDLSVELSRRRDDARRLGSLLHAMPMAALLLDDRGRIVLANGTAEAMIRAGDGLIAAPGKMLTATLPEQAARLRRAIAGARLDEAADTIFEPILRIERASGRPPLLVILTPLPRAAALFQGLDAPSAHLLVQVVDPVRRLEAAAEPLRESYGLTAAEARVAALIASGLSAPQAAESLRLSVNTVRTHLARIFDKTGANSQVALARLLSAVTPPHG